MKDVASRIANRIQLTTDGHRVYADTVEDAFGSEIDYAMLVKLYGASRRVLSRVTAPQPASAVAQAFSLEGPTRSTSAVIRRAQQSFNADGDAPIHASYKRLQQKG